MPQDDNNNQNQNSNNSVDTIDISEYNKLKSNYTSATEELNTLRSSLNEQKSRLEAFGDLTPESITEMKEKLKSFETQKVTGGNEEFEKLLQEREDAVRGELGKKITTDQERISNLEAELKHERVTKTVLSKLRDSLISGSEEFIEPLISKEIDFHKSKPDMLLILGKDGNPRRNPDNPTEYLKVEDWIEEKKQKYPMLFKASGVTTGGLGSGSRFGTSNVNSNNIDISNLTPDKAKELRSLPDYRERFSSSERVKILEIANASTGRRRN